MVITFPKQSEAMVTLFHGEGNFPFLFWYTLTKPPELQDISVKLLNLVFYSVKRNINENILKMGRCCSLQGSYSVTCWSSYASWASARKFVLFCTLTATLFVFVVCQLSREVLKEVPWTFHFKQLMKFEQIWIMCWRLKTWTLWYHQALESGCAPCIRIWRAWMAIYYCVHDLC